MGIGLGGNHLTQQPLHLHVVSHLLSHHGLFVQQVAVRGILPGGVRQQVVRRLQLLVVAQELHFGHQLVAGVAGIAVRNSAQQLPGFLDPALLGQQRGPAILSRQQVLRVFDPVEIRAGRCEILALFRDLRKRQECLRQTAAALFAGTLLRQFDILHQRDLGGGQLVVLHLQRALHQPGFGKLGPFHRDHLELLRGFGIALRIEQGPRVSHPQLRDRLPLDVTAHDRFSLRQFRIHQLERQQGRAFGSGVEHLAPARRLDRASNIPGGHSQAADGCPGRGSECRDSQILADRLLHDAGSLLLVADPRIEPGNSPQRRPAVACRRQHDVPLEQFGCLGNPVQRQQDLQHVAIGLARFRECPLPGLRRLQGRIAGARLQRDIGSPLIQCRVVGLARGVQDHRETRCRLGFLGVDLAQQELVEQLRIERCLGKFGRVLRAVRSLCVGRLRKSQQQGKRSKTVKTLHEFIIIQPVAPCPNCQK